VNIISNEEENWYGKRKNTGNTVWMR
jgi:hypothetical protein